MRILLVWLLLTNIVWAAEVVVCDPTHPQVPNAVTRSERSVDATALRGRAGVLIWEAPYTSMTPERIAEVNRLRGQLDSLQGVPVRYWKCVDLTVPPDGIVESVVEMMQVEQDALDTPNQAAALRRQTLLVERDSLERDIDIGLAAWSTLTPAQRLEVLRQSMRLNRVEQQVEE